MSLQIHDAENEEPIHILYAVLSVDDKGNEGICALGGVGAERPMVCGYERIAKKMFELATSINEEVNKTTGTNKRVVLAKFRREQ